MPSDTQILDRDSTSNIQNITLPDTWARENTTIFASGQSTALDLSLCWDFFSFPVKIQQPHFSEAYQTMLASEDVLRRDWDDPEEDALWADL